jgi:hypothetical protein
MTFKIGFGSGMNRGRKGSRHRLTFEIGSGSGITRGRKGSRYRMTFEIGSGSRKKIIPDARDCLKLGEPGLLAGALEGEAARLLLQR